MHGARVLGDIDVAKVRIREGSNCPAVNRGRFCVSAHLHSKTWQVGPVGHELGLTRASRVIHAPNAAVRGWEGACNQASDERTSFRFQEPLFPGSKGLS